MLFRAGAMELPQRLFHVPTVWGLSSLQDEVWAVDGKPEVRPVLPVILLFDHRLFDGVMAGRILVRLNDLLQSPEEHFGSDGSLAPP